MTIKNIAPEICLQSDGIFLQTMLKNMCMDQLFLHGSKLFKNEYQLSFQDMLENNKQEEHVVTDIEPVPIAPTKTSIDDFVQSLWPIAKLAAEKIGLDPKIMLAQAALETGWGKSIIKDAEGVSSNNLFNIKSGSSEEFASVNVVTTEYSSDVPSKMNAAFRKYSSVEQSFNDYISLIMESDRYQNAVAHAANPELYISELQKAGYATDPEYCNKILSIYHSDLLNQAIHELALIALIDK